MPRWNIEHCSGMLTSQNCHASVMGVGLVTALKNNSLYEQITQRCGPMQQGCDIWTTCCMCDRLPEDLTGTSSCQELTQRRRRGVSPGSYREAQRAEGTHFTLLPFSHFLSPELIHFPSLSSPCVQVPQILSPSAVIIETPTPYSLSLTNTYEHRRHCPLVQFMLPGGSWEIMSGIDQCDGSHSQMLTHTCTTSSSMRASSPPLSY